MEPQLVQSQAEDNRRRERRQRVYRRARIVFNNGYAVFDCIVRNISKGGAMLEMEILLGVPRSFQIIVDYDARPRPCQVVWHSETRMGVAFSEPRVQH